MAATNKLKFGQSATNCSEVFQGMVFIVTSLRRDKILSSIMTENTVDTPTDASTAGDYPPRMVDQLS